MSRAYYNEIDPYAASWLRNLIAAGHIANGDVDERSIADVQPDDLRGYTQCHFFAGIAGWSLALRLAGWPDDRPVWTGSCPCQPFSQAGKQEGFQDPRHLWPEFKRLIEKRLPPVVFGEQVASASAWLSLVRGDLDKMGYAVGAIPMEAASASADHKRDRYWFVADYDFGCDYRAHETIRTGRPPFRGDSLVNMEDRDCAVPNSYDTKRRTDSAAGNVVERQEARRNQGAGNVAERSAIALEHVARFGWGEGWTEHEFRSRGFTAAVASIGGWQFVECPDGKWRRLPPPGVRWLGTGIPSRVAKLRAFGNAIDPRPAAEFIKAYLDVREPSTEELAA